MDLFKPIKKLPDDRCHPKFLILRDQRPFERMIIENWANGMEDRDRKFVREFQETFHSAFWEILIYRILTDAGYDLDQTHPMPDFYIKSPKIFIEAVTANVTGEKAAKIKAEIEEYIESNDHIHKKDSISAIRSFAYGNLRSPIDQFDSLLPPYLNDNFNQNLIYSIIRYSNAISYKLKKYKETYLLKEWVEAKNPFVIAMASFDEFTYGTEYIYPMIALLYGLIYNPEIDAYVEEEKVNKTATDTIDIGLFNKEEYKQVSAIMFTCTLTMGKLTSSLISNGYPSMGGVFTIHENMIDNNPSIYPKYQAKVITSDYKEEISEGVFVFHNPNASNPIPDSFLVNTCVTNIYLEDGGIRVKGNCSPIVARYSSFVPIEALIPSINELMRLYNHITVEEFYPE